MSRTAVKLFGDQRRVNFVSNGMWALKFPSEEEYQKFLSEFQDCLLENVETTVTTLFFFMSFSPNPIFLKKITENRKFEFLMRKKGICLFVEKKKKEEKKVYGCDNCFVCALFNLTNPPAQPQPVLPDTRWVCCSYCSLLVRIVQTRGARVGWPNGPKLARTDLCPALGFKGRVIGRNCNTFLIK